MDGSGFLKGSSRSFEKSYSIYTIQMTVTAGGGIRGLLCDLLSGLTKPFCHRSTSLKLRCINTNSLDAWHLIEADLPPFYICILSIVSMR